MCNWLPCIKIPRERDWKRKKAKLRWKSRLITILKHKPMTCRYYIYIDETIRLNDTFAYRINFSALQPIFAMQCMHFLLSSLARIILALEKHRSFSSNSNAISWIMDIFSALKIEKQKKNMAFVVGFEQNTMLLSPKSDQRKNQTSNMWEWIK